MSAGVSPQVADLLYLCGRGLAGEAADAERVRGMDLARVYDLAAEQSLAGLAWYGLEGALGDVQADGALLSAWRRERDTAIRRQLLFAAEREQICRQLGEQGIWHAPLKGAVLGDWYPAPGMREFSDNDILCDSARRGDVRRIFLARGYRMNEEGHVARVDDAFTKEPVFNFEMHAELFTRSDSAAFAQYYADVRRRLVLAGDSPYDLRFSDEDFLVYLLAHAYKHFSLRGTGLRILCDLAVFREHAGAALDWEYVGRELEGLGIAEFAATLRRLVECVLEPGFDLACLRDEDAEVLVALASHGVYGTHEHLIEQELGRAEGSYIRGRILPDDDWWDMNFPFGYRHKWARPPLLLYRAVRAALDPTRRKKLATELKVLRRK